MTSLDNHSGNVSMRKCIMGPLPHLKTLEQGSWLHVPQRFMQKVWPRKNNLSAASGDTGGAVASAFYKLEGFNVNFILFPDQRVSPRQEQQLTCWGNNVTSLAVKENSMTVSDW